MNRIGLKLALFFVAIIITSTAGSFLAVGFFSRQVVDEVALDQLEIAKAIQALRDRTQLNLEDILGIVSNPNYAIHRIEVLESAGVDPESLARLAKDDIVHFQRGRLQGSTTVLRVGDAYISIGLEPHRSPFQIWFSRLWMSIVLYVVISAVLVLTLANKVVDPVLRLTRATREVARGNFDVQIETERNDEIGGLTRNFNQMVRELRTIEYLRKDFITSVSHELKTPLATIRGYAGLLQNGELSEEERSEYATVIAAEAGRLASMSATMLNLSRLENQERLEDGSPFSLDEQIRRTIVILEPQWSRKSLSFDIDLEPVEIAGNEGLLQQVWLNLIGNAIKFSPDRGRIEVRAGRESDSVTVVIRDFGLGIEPDDLPRVFDKFFQADRTRSAEGSGLGLSLVKRIVALYGGSIKADSVPGEGATFTTVLPVSSGIDS